MNWPEAPGRREQKPARAVLDLGRKIAARGAELPPVPAEVVPRELIMELVDGTALIPGCVMMLLIKSKEEQFEVADGEGGGTFASGTDCWPA